MANSPHFIGMHFSGQRFHAALVDGAGEVLERREAEFSPQAIVEQATAIASDLFAVSGNVAAIG